MPRSAHMGGMRPSYFDYDTAESILGIDGSVTQRVTGWPNGECVRASYAALLEIPIDLVPRFDPGAAATVGAEQGDLERAWLCSIGLDLFEIAVRDPETQTLPPEVLACMPKVPHLMSGISPRGYGHRCVGVGGKVVFDPHPSRAGLLTVYSVGLLVPLKEDEE